MHLSRAVRLLVVGLSALSVAEATFVNTHFAQRDAKGLQRRQEEPPGDGGSPSAGGEQDNSTSASAASESSSEPTPTPSSSEPEPSSSSPSPSSSASPPPAPSSEPPTPSPPIPSSNNPRPPSSTPQGPSSPTRPPVPPPTEDTEPPVVDTTTVVITTTDGAGNTLTTTSEMLSTRTPGLANNGGSNGQTGMTETTRNTIIGVAVGVGGSIVLGALAFAAWRIWGRKKDQEENDGLMGFNGTEKSEASGPTGSASGRTPFQSTLESYHTPVNTASNF